MTPSMIEEMVHSFALLHGDAETGGLDGVDIHASSGYLMNSSYRQLTTYAQTNTGVL